jgi:type I restriction enzyme, S subunit
MNARDGSNDNLRRFKPYPDYRDSGVEWLGALPVNWEAKPFKALLARNDSGVWGEDTANESDVIVLRSTDQTVDGRWIIENPARRALTSRERAEARLEAGDLVVTKSSGSELHIGKTSLVDSSIAALGSCFSNFMQRLRVTKPSRLLLVSA